jgi:ribosomal protein S18 acetylase RimI-like enzyme
MIAKISLLLLAAIAPQSSMSVSPAKSFSTTADGTSSPTSSLRSSSSSASPRSNASVSNLLEINLVQYPDESSTTAQEYRDAAELFCNLFNDREGPYKENNEVEETIDLFKGWAKHPAYTVSFLKSSVEELIGFLVTVDVKLLARRNESDFQKYEKRAKIVRKSFDQRIGAEMFHASGKARKQIFVEEVGIKNSWQGKKLSKMMMANLIKQEKEANLHLTTSHDEVLNKPALQLYRSLGFKTTGKGEDQGSATRIYMTRKADE